MSLTPSNMLPLGTEAPDFELWDAVSNSLKTLNNLKGPQGTLILFICNHCPFVIHINKALVSIANTLKDKGIGVVAISSNDVENYPQDGPEQMQIHADFVGNFPWYSNRQTLLLSTLGGAMLDVITETCYRWSCCGSCAEVQGLD